MFSSLVEFFSTEKTFIHTKKRRSSSLQGSLPAILLTTTCIDFEPLSPLTTTDPINVPLTYHGHGKTYSSSLDSLGTSRTNSLASSVSSSSSYGYPTTPVFSSLSDDNGDGGPSPISFTTTSSMYQVSCGNMDDADHYRHPASAIALKSIPQPGVTTKIESNTLAKIPLFENFRHSLSFFFVAPSFTSTMPWTTPPIPAQPPAPAPTEIVTPITTTSTSTTTTTALTYDNVFFEEDCTMTKKSIPEHPHQHPHQHRPQSMYTRALRENPDHLRMIVSEVNMMRVNKLISPLRPRAFLLERTDPFIPYTPSPLRHIV